MTGAVDVFAWNPVRERLGWQRRFRDPAPLNNFGDLLGPLVVELARRRHGSSRTGARRARLVSIGSVLHFAEDGDTVWGTGLNGKVGNEEHRFSQLDVRAVRGPLTGAFLQQRGIEAPAVYGDPALLLPELLPQLREWSTTKKHGVTVVPNFHDLRDYRYRTGPSLLSPVRPVMHCLRRIAQSEFVTGSSLHGVVVAESLGIPARLIAPGAEPDTKYRDYYAGTGRDGYTPAVDVRHALRLGGEPPLRWDGAPLLDAFPVDLWEQQPAADAQPPASTSS